MHKKLRQSLKIRGRRTVPSDIPTAKLLCKSSSLVPMLANAALILVATVLMPAVAAKAINATTKAYSIKS